MTRPHVASMALRTFFDCFGVGIPTQNRAQNPGAAGDGVGFEKLERGGGGHLRRDDGGQVVLHADEVDSRQFAVFDNNTKVALEDLIFASLPVEIDADDDVMYEERAVFGSKSQFVVLFPIEENLAVMAGSRMLFVVLLTVRAGIECAEGETDNRLLQQDAYL